MGVMIVMNNNYSSKNKKFDFDASSLTNDELVQATEEYNKRLERAEVSLREWIDFRNVWAIKGTTKKRKLSLQKKEAIGH